MNDIATTSVAAGDPADANSDLVWNFAFGSNMSQAKRVGRAHLTPLEVVPARIDGWRIAFDLPGLSWIEPSMASIEPAPGEAVHGVLLCLSRGQFEALDRSEGAGRAYVHQPVEAIAYDGRRIGALAFRCRPERRHPHDIAPSARYLALLCQGAAECGLDAAYRAQLAAIAPAQTSKLAQALATIFIDFMMFMTRHRLSGLAHGYFRLMMLADVRLPLGLHWLLIAPISAPALLLGALAGRRRRRRDPTR